MMPPEDEIILLIDNRQAPAAGGWPEAVDLPGAVFIPEGVQDVNRVSGFPFPVFILPIIHHR